MIKIMRPLFKSKPLYNSESIMENSRTLPKPNNEEVAKELAEFKRQSLTKDLFVIYRS